VRHLLNVGEILGARLLTGHNLYRYAETMREIRAAIAAGTFGGYRRRFLDEWREPPGASEERRGETE